MQRGFAARNGDGLSFGYDLDVPRLFLLLLLLLAVTTLVRMRSARRGVPAQHRWLPKGWPDACHQLALFALADVCYETVRGVAEGNAAAAFENARSIVDLEQSTGLFFERGLQNWAMDHRILIDAANFMYVNSHFVITTCFLVWLYLRHNKHFYFVRNVFMVAMALALVGYLAMPTAPPRFLPELGFVDTISYYTEVRHDSALVSIFVNPYAAVPSMHVAFSLITAGAAIALVRRRWLKLLWAVYPIVVTLVVIITGNHWVFDAMAGAFVAVVSAVVARAVLSRIRPAAWAWSPSVPEAAT